MRFVYSVLFVTVVSFQATRVDVYASPPAPAPNCYVAGTIEHVEFNEAYQHPCVKTNRCRSDAVLETPARYKLVVSVDTVHYINGDTKFRSCESLFPLRDQSTIYLLADNVSKNSNVSVSQRIEGTVATSGESYFTTHKYVTENNSTQPKQSILQRLLEWFRGLFT